MPAKIELDGWDALMAQIRDAPKEIRDEVRPLVHEHTEGAAEDLRRHYPEASHTAKGTGNLRARVRTVYPTTANSLTGKVLSMAPHAHWYHWNNEEARDAEARRLESRHHARRQASRQRIH